MLWEGDKLRVLQEVCHEARQQMGAGGGRVEESRSVAREFALSRFAQA